MDPGAHESLGARGARLGAMSRALAAALPPVAAAAVPRAGLAWQRLPLLACGLVALLAGIAAGLLRLGWAMPSAAVHALPWHGPLMVCGFFGVVIALERAVALGRAWGYAGVALAAAGTGAALAGAASLPYAGWGGAAALLLAATLRLWQRQREPFVLVLALAAAAWLAGNVLAGLAASPLPALPWWIAFLVLTIAGERLELSRLRPRPRGAETDFVIVMALLALGLLLGLARPDAGVRLFGAALLALAAWLARHDLARATLRMPGTPRYVALCLLAGYAWLATGGLLMALAGLPGAGPLQDAALHAVFVGFVLSMVYGHAPIIVPAVLRASVRFSRWLYAPLLLLHLATGLRIGGDLAGFAPAVRGGALASAVSIAAFAVLMASRTRARR